jgi:hypothetical protein
MFVVCVVYYQVEVSATSWSLVQRSPTECGASLCVIKKPRERGGHSPRWAAEPEIIIIIIILRTSSPGYIGQVTYLALLSVWWIKAIYHCLVLIYRAFVFKV